MTRRDWTGGLVHIDLGAPATTPAVIESRMGAFADHLDALAHAARKNSPGLANELTELATEFAYLRRDLQARP